MAAEQAAEDGVGAPGWVPDALFYAVNPDRFARGTAARPCAWDPGAFEAWDAPPSHLAYKGGDLWGLAERLDDLRALGVDALLLTPIFRSVTNHRYKTLDHLQVDPLLGGDAALEALLAGAHARGMRVVLDGVFNHVGLGFPAFQDVLAYGERSPWRRWFLAEGWPLNPYDPSQPARYRCWNDNRSMPELDLANPAVRAYVGDVVEHWLRRGADGWRFDAPERLRDPALWRELRRRARAARPDAYLVGECWGDPAPWLDGTQWDGATSYPLLFALYRFAIGRRLRQEHLLPASRDHQRPSDAPRFAREVEALLARTPWPGPLAQLQFLSSFDVARFLTVAGGDRASLALGTLLLLTLPGVPCLYYGDEVGMEGGLPPASRAGYPERARWDEGVLALHRELAALRRAHPALRRGRPRTVLAEGGLFVFERALRGAPGAPEEAVLVAVNAGDAPAEAALALGAPGQAAVLWGRAAVAAGGGGWRVTLPARAGAVLRGA